MITAGDPFTLYRNFFWFHELHGSLAPEYGLSETQDFPLLNVKGADGLPLDECLLLLLVDKRVRILAYMGQRREGAEVAGWGDLEDERVRVMTERMERRIEVLRVLEELLGELPWVGRSIIGGRRSAGRIMR